MLSSPKKAFLFKIFFKYTYYFQTVSYAYTDFVLSDDLTMSFVLIGYFAKLLFRDILSGYRDV